MSWQPRVGATAPSHWEGGLQRLAVPGGRRATDDDVVRRHDLSGSCEELLDAGSIRLEALDDLAVDHERRRGAALPRVDQLIARPRIGLDVLRFVGDAVLPKELFGGAAIASARLMVESYTRYHAALLSDRLVVDHGNPPHLVVLHSLHTRRHIRQERAEPLRHRGVCENGIAQSHLPMREPQIAIAGEA